MDEDTYWQYGEMYINHRPTHGRVSRRMANDYVIMPMRNFMGLVTIIAHYANLIDVAGYTAYKRVDMGQNVYKHIKVLANYDFFDVHTITDPCSPYEVKDKTIKSHRHNFTLWIGSDLDGTYKVHMAVCDTTIHDMNRGHEYENVLYYSCIRYEHWSEFM